MTKGSDRMGRAAAQGGYGLLEVLAAVVILSVGLLGLANLQIRSLRSDSSAFQRSLATFYAYDMADRIRANPAGRLSGSYDAIDTDSVPADPGCIDTGCTPQQLAQYDAFAWGSLLQANLPTGGGRVQADGETFIVTVMWDDERLGVTGTGCDPHDPDDLKCFDITVRP
jgi:type IV pilus assembly protein PilV